MFHVAAGDFSNDERMTYDQVIELVRRWSIHTEVSISMATTRRTGVGGCLSDGVQCRPTERAV